MTVMRTEPVLRAVTCPVTGSTVATAGLLEDQVTLGLAPAGLTVICNCSLAPTFILSEVCAADMVMLSGGGNGPTDVHWAARVMLAFTGAPKL